MLDILSNTLHMILEAAPWLLLGLLAAGLLRAWLPQQRLARWLGGRGVAPVTRAALIGTPLPICSCGVVPIALGLHRSGAGRSATTSFLIATPENGADSIALSYVLLGPFMTIARPLAAIASGIVTGLAVGLVPGRTRTPDGDGRAQASPADPACCGGTAARGSDRAMVTLAVAAPAPPAWTTARASEQALGSPLREDETASCCAGEATAAAGAAGCEDECCGRPEAGPERTGLQRTWDGLRYAATDILDDMSLYLLFGLVVAGVTVSFVPPSALAQWGSGLPAMLAMLVIGVPLYVCATESTPIAAAMLFAGISPGTVLVFLLAGPATNLGTLAALRREFGTRWLGVYLAGVAASTLAAGLLTDALAHALDIDVAVQSGAAAGALPAWLGIASALVLAVLAIRPLRRRLPGFRARAA